MKAFISVVVIYLMLVLAVHLAHCQPVLPPTYSEFDMQLIRFNDTWNKFFRKHFNCSPDARYLQDCRVDENSTSYDGFPKVIKEFTKSFIGGN